MAELPLDDDEPYAFASHLDGMCVPQLVWREASPDTGFECGPAQIGSHRGA